MLNEEPDQTGFSRTTSSIMTTDFGVNWLLGDPRRGISPLTDPFPVRADGSRFDVPTGNRLGVMARTGRGYSFSDYNRPHARQQRWRFGIQRQLGSDMMIDVAYAGSYSDRVGLSRVLSALPEQFWASGMARNNDIANNLNANVTNPFRLTNFQSLASSHPLIYQDMSTQSFYTSSTIRKNQLLRPFPHMNGLTDTTVPTGEVRTDALEVSFQRRFARGFNLNVSYTRLRDDEADTYLNEFDPLPTWRESNDGRPHRLAATGIYELPFGRGRAFARSGIVSHIAGGFQAAATFEWQPGPLVNWGNVFYYGDLKNINTGERSLDRWFNTSDFERVAARTPAAFHRRIFPTRIDGLRRDSTNQWNVNLQRDFRITERVVLQLRGDALNIQNRSQFSDPNTTPTSTDFGRITSQTNTRNRFIQVQARLRF